MTSKLAQPVDDRIFFIRTTSFGLLFGRRSLEISYRRRSTVTLSAIVCLIGTLTLAVAQDNAKSASAKWRPKDGPYIEAGRELTGSCEAADPFLFGLSKKHFGIEERYGCKVTKITDTAPGALRLDMTCNESDNADDGEDGKDYKEVMTLRKIDDRSFFMRMTVKGKFPRPEWRVDYCTAPPADKWPSAFEIKRDAVQNELKSLAWRPRDGAYANPGSDFDGRCMKSGDAVIDFTGISISSGASRCEISKVSDATQASIKLEAQCDLKSGQSGQVARPKNGAIVFVPVGSEDIIITNSGNQTITLQKSRNGEFSELGQLLTYCPDTAQRAYADSKKAK
jgi:hypothetical protein